MVEDFTGADRRADHRTKEVLKQVVCTNDDACRRKGLATKLRHFNEETAARISWATFRDKRRVKML